MELAHTDGRGTLKTPGIVRWLVLALALSVPSLIPPSAAAQESPREVADDWRLQDRVPGARSYREAVLAMAGELAGAAAAWRGELARLDQAGVPAGDPRWEALYLRACVDRRATRLRNLLQKAPRIIFTKHFDLGGSHYAYTEGQSDAQAERHFQPGSSLCLLVLDGVFGSTRTLLCDRGGVIRDPDVSHDARRVLFAWKKSLNEDDYHLYEMKLADGSVRQLTFGLGFADYEGAYAPNGNIIFNSTRCVQTVDCWWTEVSNLYTCDGDGRHLRRLAFDQVHSNFPTVTPDGRVLYTRWEYNDRGQIFVQGLFQMNPDGTGQTAFYGNNSWFPTTILHARAIPGTQKVVAVFSGHHTTQKGWLGILDPARGREENQGARLIAPVRTTEAVRIDAYGQEGDQFQYPYPLNECEFLVALRPAGVRGPFAIYWVDQDGRRELLAWDPSISCNQPIPLAPRPTPPQRPEAADYRQTQGVCCIQDIYEGLSLAGVPRGAVKKLRVVALVFRAAGIGENRSQGAAGAALSSTPVSIGNGAWDPKVVLGEATVHEDGSALFAVPSRTPLYFQALDQRGRVVQTMRSWTTLQPGERVGCVGCHESRNTTPRWSATVPRAFRAGVEWLSSSTVPARGFSFPKDIQPILDRHCVRCHHRSPAEAPPAPQPDAAFSLLAREVVDPAAKRRWSEAYLALTQSAPRSIVGGPMSYIGRPGELVNWIEAQSPPSPLPPYSAGAAKSRLLALLEDGHYDVKLTEEELARLACWIDLGVPFCGDYREANAWSPEELARYDHFETKRRQMEQIERQSIDALLGLPSPTRSAKTR